MKLYKKTAKQGILGLSGSLLLLWSLSGYAETQSDVLALAKNSSEIRVVQEQLAPAIKQYLMKNRKLQISKDEKVAVLREIVGKQLIMDLDAVDALRQDSEIKQKVQAYENKLILNAYLKKNIANGISVSEEEMKAYYKQNKQKYALPPQVEASHILLRTRADAENVLRKLKEAVDFGQLVADYSIDLPLAITEKGKMSPEPIPKGVAMDVIEQVLFSLAEGEVSDIVETQFGYHIIRVDKIIPVSYKPFQKVAGREIKPVLGRQKYQTAYDKLTAELEKAAGVEIFENRIQ
jgi:parvulin-like peptidyl-prolyl isomerase